MSWLTVISKLDMGNFVMALVMRGWSDSSMATCQTLIMEVVMMTSVLLRPPWLLEHKQTLVQYPSESSINHLTATVHNTFPGSHVSNHKSINYDKLTFAVIQLLL